jgi:hypothetical protein
MIISTVDIPFPVSTRIHLHEEYIEALNKELKAENPGRARRLILKSPYWQARERDHFLFWV